MLVSKIRVFDKEGIYDAIGQGILKDIRDLGVKDVQDVRFALLYYISGDIDESGVRRIAEELLIDKITQEYSIGSTSLKQDKQGYREIEIAYNPGVMDPVEDSALKAISDLGILGVTSIRTAKQYLLKGDISEETLLSISEKLLYNKVIQHITRQVNGEHASDSFPGYGFGYMESQTIALPAYGFVYRKPNHCSLAYMESQTIALPAYRFKLIDVDILGADKKKLQEISKNGQLFLNALEMQAIKDYFKSLKRNPTDVELESIAQTWSEHCWHKTFRGKIEYKEVTSNQKPVTRKINNLLKSTIMKVTQELKKPWCVSVFKDNSGIIKFDDEYNVCFKVETHNHPSALEPFGGANTGIGGVIRDPLGTGLGAKPILNTDVFCFGPPDYPFNKLPKGTLHPKRIMKGVVSGVRDYGNKMGIPTVNGAILFHEGFIGNPLVYCGTVGIMPKDKSFKEAKEGDYIVLVGGRTGRDGIHGATFSSGELTHESEKISSSAVQIGNPITEKKMLDTILQARDKNLYNAITDCGAGGLSSAVGEMGSDLGAKVYLEKVPLKYEGLSYSEIWISESQERMVLSVSKENTGELIEVFSQENVEATVIGEFTNTKRLELYYKNNLVCNLDMRFLHEGLPKFPKKAVYVQVKHKEPRLSYPSDLTKYLLGLLSSYDICSKEWVIRQYDHEVQGGSVLKPLVGIVNDGPSDASVVKPILNSSKGIIVANGINFRFGLIDPYWMAASCIDEALRQIIAVGGSLKEVAILDNFCWGNPDKPDRLGGLVRAACGCYDIAKGFGVPFISGKDSLYNEYTVNNKSLAIPGTLLISSLAVMDDTDETISMYAKEAGDLIYAIGLTYDELGGSQYYNLLGFIGNAAPKVYPKKAKLIFDSLSKASSLGLIKAMHDCSEGGIGVAAAEMAFSGGLGMDIFLSEAPYKIKNPRHKNWRVRQELWRKDSKREYLRNDYILFSESNSRFIVEVEKRNQKEFEKILKAKAAPFGLIGCVSKEKEFKVYGTDNKVCVRSGINELKEAWQRPLRW